MKNWQMQQAKARLSELVQCAHSHGPQQITVHGKPVAVLMSHEAYERLSQGRESFAAFMRRSPLFGTDDLEFERDNSPLRDAPL